MARPYEIETVVLAYELRCEGMSWKCIAQTIGKSAGGLRSAVGRVKRHGINAPLKVCGVTVGRKPMRLEDVNEQS